MYAASSAVEGPVPEGTVIAIAADPLVVGAVVSEGADGKCVEGSGISSIERPLCRRHIELSAVARWRHTAHIGGQTRY